MDNRKNSKDLNIANREINLLNEEKEHRIAELKSAYQEISLQIEERGSRAAELAIANIELEFQNQEKEKRAAELVIANKEMIFQSKEKGKRAAELVIANQELLFQSKEKENRAAELLIANEELVFQNQEKEDRAAELFVANKELAFQNQEKEKRAAELSLANIELQRAEAAVRKLNAELEQRVIDRSAQYNFISQVNQTIVHVKDADTLFSHSCRIAYEFGKFKMAWIGSFDSKREKISLLDHSGVPDEDIKHFHEVSYLSNEPQNYVLRTGGYFLCNDIEHSTELEKWKPYAAKHQIRSCIVLPIKKSGVVFGTFNLYAGELNFFNEENISLVVEVAGDISFALDIFERAVRHKEAEELIIRNEHRFRALIENSIDIKTLATIDGKRFYASPAVFKVLGYTIEDFQNTTFNSTIHPDDIAIFYSKLKEILLKPGSTFQSEHRLRHKNGSYVWCEGTITNMIDEPGVNAIVSNLRDISDKKITEQLQQFWSSNLNALINNNSDLMWSVNRNFELITSNTSFDNIVKLLSGNKIEAAAGKNILDLGFPEEQSRRYKRYYERAFSGEAFTEIEYTNVEFEYWSEISFNPIRRGEEIIGTACHAHNITDIKKSEKQVKESEAFTLGILNSLNYHIAVINESGEIVAVNEAWKQFALENGETTLHRTCVGSNYFKVCENSAKDGDEIASTALKGLLDVLNEKKPSLYLEYPCDSPEIKRWFGMRAMKFDSEVPMIVIVHMDISERKLTEENLVRRNRDLEQFTFIISHNLRAPTANIIGLTEILIDEKLSSQDQKEFVQALSTSALGLDTVIKDINSILQVKHEDNEKKELISLTQLVDEIIISNNDLISISQVRIKLDFSEIDEISSLKVYLHSIFYNLISNSIKYSKPDVPPLVEIKSRKEKGKIIITFKDNGLGFDLKATGKKMFGLYKRFHSHVEGKGMGLFMVKTQVEAIGGRISVTSEVNIGTEFTIILGG